MRIKEQKPTRTGQKRPLRRVALILVVIVFGAAGLGIYIRLARQPLGDTTSILARRHPSA